MADITILAVLYFPLQYRSLWQNIRMHLSPLAGVPLFKCQSSFTYIKIFNYDSFNLNQILMIRSGDIDLNQVQKNHPH